MGLKTAIRIFMGCLGVCCYTAAFLWFMYKAIIAPVEVNPWTPAYSIAWIVAWVMWICFGAVLWGWVWGIK